MRAGIAVGAVSALLVAMFGSLNKRLVEHGDPLTVTALELGAGTLTLTLLAPLMPLLFPAFAGPLLVRARATTTSPCCWACRWPARCCRSRCRWSALRHMSAFAQQLAVNLEPVYAIVLAVAAAGRAARADHRCSTSAWSIILAAVFVHPLLGKPRRLQHPEVLGTAEAKGAAE